MPSTPARNGVRLQTLPAQVAGILAGRIVDGAIRDGEVPSELTISREFGVSRVVAREALKLLASVNMVAIAQGRRIVLRPSDEWDYLSPLMIEWLPPDQVLELLRELRQVRLMIEPALAATAAACIDADALGRVREQLERMPELEGDPDAYMEADIAFHTEIAKAARNRLLDRIMYASRWLMIASRRFTNRQDRALSKATAAHRAVYAALEAHDVAAAREAMRVHVTGNVSVWSGAGIPPIGADR